MKAIEHLIAPKESPVWGDSFHFTVVVHCWNENRAAGAHDRSAARTVAELDDGPVGSAKINIININIYQVQRIVRYCRWDLTWVKLGKTLPLPIQYSRSFRQP